VSKEPKSLVPADPMRLTPAWRISKLEMVDPLRLAPDRSGQAGGGPAEARATSRP